jgi:hypothetical protein
MAILPASSSQKTSVGHPLLKRKPSVSANGFIVTSLLAGARVWILEPAP